MLLEVSAINRTKLYDIFISHGYVIGFQLCKESVTTYIYIYIYAYLRNEQITFPTTAVEKQVVKQKFMEKIQFPSVTGALD